MRTKKSHSILIGTLVTSGLFGYLLGFSFGKKKNLHDDTLLNAIQNSSIDTCGEEKKRELENDRSLASGVLHSDYLSVLEKHHLEGKDREFAAAFPRTELGHALTRLLTLLDFGTTSNGIESKIFLEDLKWIERQDQESFVLIREGLKKLGPEHQAEQQYLIQLVARLDIEFRDKIEFLFAELVKSSSGSALGIDAKHNRYNRMVTLTSLIQVEADPTLLEDSVRHTLAEEANYGSKVLLLNLYEVKYPDSAQKLRAELKIDSN